MSMREEFEVWYGDEVGLGAEIVRDWREGDEYGAHERCDIAWWGWQASRAALVVELPAGGYWAGYDNEHMMESRDVREALSEAGITVRP